MALLEVRGLEKWYGRRQVVNGVDFEVNRGEVVGLLGPNGAGKTTSFRMTIGLIDADGGSVIFDGQDVTKMPMFKRARAGMGYLAQDSSVFKQLSVENNLMAILETRAEMSRKQRKDRQNELLDLFGLTKIRKTKANRVSGGERRRLEIARSLITEPKLIMLDEPFAGIDPKTVAEIQDQIRNLVHTFNIGILLTDHNIRETLEVTERSYLIHEGRVFAYGNPEQIATNPEARRVYLGDRFDFGHLLDRKAPHPSLNDPAALPEPLPVAPLPPPPSLRASEPLASPEDVGAIEIPADLVESSMPTQDIYDDPTANMSTYEDPTHFSLPPDKPPTPGRFEGGDADHYLGASITIQGNVVYEEVDYRTEFPEDEEPGKRRS
jgi:lipopolysaccharide export system ATP-binding protein